MLSGPSLPRGPSSPTFTVCMLEKDEPPSMFNLKFLSDSRHDRDDIVSKFLEMFVLNNCRTLMSDSELRNYVQINK